MLNRGFPQTFRRESTMFQLQGIDSQEENRTEPQGLERRAFARFPVDEETFCATHNGFGQERWKVRVRDISLAGLAMVAPARVECNSNLVVNLQIGGNGYSRPMIVQVVRCEQMTDGGWLLGCKFTRKLSDADLRSLIR
jgi:hypothetical protein